MMKDFVLGSMLLGCVAFAGCGSSELKGRPTIDVSGSVTLDGSPLAEGEVILVNVPEGVREVFAVKGGNFAGKASPGSRRVEVCAYKEQAPNKDATDMYGADAKPSMANYLPAKYNTESTLTADIKEGGAPLKFEVTSQ
jgi:hypothetical protein